MTYSRAAATAVEDAQRAGEHLLHHLRRPDVFPAADLGLLHGAQSAFGLQVRPTPAELAERAERWRPLRSYAAALLWARASAQVSLRR